MSQDVTEAGKALARESQPVWRFAILIGVISGALVGFVEFDAKRARAVAQEVIGPLEKKMDEHITHTNALLPQMTDFVEEHKKSMKAIRNNQYKMCAHLKLKDCEQP